VPAALLLYSSISKALNYTSNFLFKPPESAFSKLEGHFAPAEEVFSRFKQAFGNLSANLTSKIGCLPRKTRGKPFKMRVVASKD
jgi:hypothetical protein